MMKKAAGKQATAETSVFWDITLCPVPHGVDPLYVRPCIKRFLEKHGYSGPLTMNAFGVLTDVPNDILRGVYSSGISLTNVPYGSGYEDTMDVIFAFFEKNRAPANIMVISDPKIFRGIPSEYLHAMGCHLVQPRPYDSLESLIQEVPLEDTELQTDVSACLDCILCCSPPVHDIEDFIRHLSGEGHKKHRMSHLWPNNNAVPRLPMAPLEKGPLMTWDWLPSPSDYSVPNQKAVTLVFWDINKCPVPPFCGARLVGPCIKQFLVKKGYLGPHIIIAFGLLAEVNIDFLRGVYSSGILLTNVPYGSSDIERLIMEFRHSYPSPANIMVISVTEIFPSIIKYLELSNYNLLQPFPCDSLEIFCPADSVALEEDECRETAYWFCSVCYPSLAYKGYDNFITHLYSGHHQQKVLDLLPRNVGHPPPGEFHERNQEAVTAVFWDINRCPVPRGLDISLAGPTIKRFLENKGYFGPLTITAVGVLADIPLDILRGVYSSGISLDNNTYGCSETETVSSSIENSVFEYTDGNPPSANIMVICDPETFTSISEDQQVTGEYNLLPYFSFQSLLPKVSGALEGVKCTEKGESACVCSVCCPGLVEKDFEKFSTHLSSREHKWKMSKCNKGRSSSPDRSMLPTMVANHLKIVGKVQETGDVNKKKMKYKKNPKGNCKRRRT